jgi:hypothetical protein
VENVGYSNLPEWRTVTRFNYYAGAFSAGLTWRFQTDVKSGARQANPNSPTLGGPSYSRFDANARYSLGDLDLGLSISNLLDKEPPAYGYNPWTTGAGTFLPSADLVGRRFTLTATMNYCRARSRAALPPGNRRGPAAAAGMRWTCLPRFSSLRRNAGPAEQLGFESCDGFRAVLAGQVGVHAVVVAAEDV